MSKETKRDLIVGLDIGTSKIVAIVGELDAEGRLGVLGIGTQESTGLKRGMVINIEATVNSISRAIAEVEMMAGCKVREVYTGIAGSHIKSKDSTGMAVVRDKEVTQFDVERAIEAANATSISADDQILHTLVQEFIVDGQDGVKEPIGMDARRLDVKVHLVTGAVTAVQNIVKCVHRCGLEVVDLVLQPLASGYAVLTEDEKDVGVCLVDIGGGTTDVAVFVQGAIRHTAVIPIAGDQLTNDIAIALRTSTQDAEDIKIRYGVALQQLADPGGNDRGARRRRPSLDTTVAPDPGRFHPAAGRGNLPEGAGGVAAQRQGAPVARRHRAHRWRGADAGHGRAGRGDFSQHREAGDAALRRQFARLRAQSALLHGDGFVAGRGGAAPPWHEGAEPEKLRAGSGADEGVVHPKFLKRLVFSGGEKCLNSRK
jgi:cell division protein FtsA